MKSIIGIIAMSLLVGCGGSSVTRLSVTKVAPECKLIGTELDAIDDKLAELSLALGETASTKLATVIDGLNAIILSTVDRADLVTTLPVNYGSKYETAYRYVAKDVFDSTVDISEAVMYNIFAFHHAGNQELFDFAGLDRANFDITHPWGAEKPIVGTNDGDINIRLFVAALYYNQIKEAVEDNLNSHEAEELAAKVALLRAYRVSSNKASGGKHTSLAYARTSEAIAERSAFLDLVVSLNSVDRDSCEDVKALVEKLN